MNLVFSNLIKITYKLVFTFGIDYFPPFSLISNWVVGCGVAEGLTGFSGTESLKNDNIQSKESQKNFQQALGLFIE